ncbi:MAG: FAD-dependent monooxygenase [Halioglobus sp.]
MELPAETDVLIVGAGPVGTAMANILGRLGVRTLLIDKLPTIQLQPRAIALDNEALRILQLAGLDDHAFARLVIPEVRMHSPIFGEFARMNTAHELDGHPMLVTFFQPELEQALHDALARYPAVQVARPVEWLSTTEEATGCVVTLRWPDGTDRTLRAQYVVAADGASSPVRNALGMAFQGSSYAEDWLIVDALGAHPPIDHVEFLCNSHRPGPHMPAPGGRQRWEFMLRRGETREDMMQPEQVRQLLAPWADLDTLTVERTAVYRFHARTVSQFRRGRTLLVGDAAHVTPPFVGQGLVAGLRDVANLGWKLAWVVHGRASTGILDSYHTERQPHARSMIRLAQWMGRLIMPRSRCTAFFSHGIARLMTLIPGLRGLIVDVRIKPRNRFSRGLFVPRGGADRFEHGNHLAQGPLRNRREGSARSDDVLGQQLQLIGIGVDPQSCLSAAQRERWAAHGGATVCIHGSGAAAPVDTAWEDIDGVLGAQRFPDGWLIVVRPDKVILADGQPEQGGRLVETVLALLR